MTDFAGEITFMTQAVDGAGNVAVSRAKGQYFMLIPVTAGADQTVNEGEEIAFNGSGPTEATIMWDFGDGLGATDNYTATHWYRDNGLFDVSLRVGDEEGHVGMDILLATVNNVAPTVHIDEITSLISGSIFPGDVITVTASFTDPAVLDTHTGTIDWDDGTVMATTINQSAGFGTISSSHTYTDDGTFTLEVCVTDDDNGLGCDSLQVTVHCSAADVAVTSVAAELDTSVKLTARVTNIGGTEVPIGLPVAFYLGNPSANGALIATAATTTALAFEDSEDVTFSWDMNIGGDHAIYVIADDDGTGTGQLTECDEANNTTQHAIFISWRLYLPLIWKE